MVIDVTVKCENRDKFILKIQQLEENIQMGLMNCIQNNETLLKLTKEQCSIDETFGKDKDNSIFHLLTLNNRISDNTSQNCSFSNIEKLNLNVSFHGRGSYFDQSSVEEDGKFSFERKENDSLQYRVKTLERENRIYRSTQQDFFNQ